jgi:hypothetical protein
MPEPEGPNPTLELLREWFEEELAFLGPESRKTLDRALEHCVHSLEGLCPLVVQKTEQGSILAHGPLLGAPLGSDRQLFLFVTNTGRSLNFITDWRRFTVPPMPDDIRSVPGELRRTAFWAFIYNAVESEDREDALCFLAALVGENGKAAALERVEEIRRAGLTPVICSLAGRNSARSFAGLHAIIHLKPPVDLVIQKGAGNA